MMKTGENIHFNRTTSCVKALVNEFSKFDLVSHIRTKQMLKKKIILPVRYIYMYVTIVCKSIG